MQFHLGQDSMSWYSFKSNARYLHTWKRKVAVQFRYNYSISTRAAKLQGMPDCNLRKSGHCLFNISSIELSRNHVLADYVLS